MAEEAQKTEDQLKAAGAKVGFGVNQLNKPTPIWMSKLANGIIFAGMAWAMASGMLPEIPEDIKADITRYVLLFSGLIKLATKFFGLEVKTETN